MKSKILKCFSDVILRDSICSPIHQTKESKEKAVKKNIGRDNEKYLKKYFEKYREKYQENYLRNIERLNLPANPSNQKRKEKGAKKKFFSGKMALH